MNLGERTRRFTTQWMTIDLRALGAFRIALAFTVLIDLLDRARAFTLYTDEGPLAVAGDFSVLTFHRGPPAWVAALFVAQALLAVAFALGWRTRVVAVVLFAFVVSLQQRCWAATYLGDELTRVMLFWACVLPVGARFSVDSARSRAPGSLRSFAAGGLLLVPVTVFVFTALEKLGSSGWRDARALELLLDTWVYPTALGAAFAERAPSLLAPLTALALVAEVAFPLMLLLPWWRARAFAAAGLLALMFGIALMFDVGLFPLVTATALLPLVPSEVWSRGTPEKAGTTDEAVQRARRPALDLVALACALTMIVTSAVNMLGHEVPQPLGGALKVLGLNQRWPMFIHPEAAPRGWFLVAGRTADGTEVDVLRGTPLDATHVPEPMSTVLTFRERRVLQRAYIGGGDAYREGTSAWLCRSSPTPLGSISVGYAEVRGEPPAVLVIEIVKDQLCPAP